MSNALVERLSPDDAQKMRSAVEFASRLSKEARKDLMRTYTELTGPDARSHREVV